MSESSLTSKQRRFLKGRAHGDKVPLCHIGKDGLSEPALASIRTTLTAHELIKVHFVDKEDIDRHELAEQTAKALGAELVQVIGFKAVLYRANPENPRIVLPS